eukprot:TRINITY_DN6736_c0_g1_i2.p5 TRINITY_DN6736_c0_g1~~TRINITY_DN6736_c0_g1_i2.p5  ORF type:complete len:105 (-),score=30.11 TRINITY_DN6736_c0_g1_i2:49-363(-)
MDPNADADLMWIAREGYLAPVPSPWIQCTDSEGETYFYNKETEEKKWEHPMDGYYKEMYLREKAKKEQTDASEKREPVEEKAVDGIEIEAVSYTHLTLPTICSV